MNPIYKHQNIAPFFFVSTFLLMLGGWIFVITPAIEKNDSNINTIIEQKKELQALRDLKNQMIALEKKMIAEDKNSTQTPQESILKQMETVAKENKVFSKISRVSPTTIRKDGKDIKALSIELENISLFQLTPFMHALSHQSLLEIESIDIRRSSKTEGQIEARLMLSQL